MAALEDRFCRTAEIEDTGHRNTPTTLTFAWLILFPDAVQSSQMLVDDPDHSNDGWVRFAGDTSITQLRCGIANPIPISTYLIRAK